MTGTFCTIFCDWGKVMDRIILLYLIMMNILNFIIFGHDKWKAVHGKWRIRESALLGLSLVGGAPGEDDIAFLI